MKKNWYLFLLAASYFQVNAQLSGVLSVPATYTSLASVISALNTQGVSGAVTVNIASGYVETVIPGGFSLTASGSPASPIVFRKSGTGSNPLLIAYSGGSGTPGSMYQDGVWRLIGCDYITIDAIDIVDQNTVNPSTMEFGIGLFKASSNDGCQNNIIKNCSITLNRINNASGSGAAEDGSRGIDVVNTVSGVHNSVISVSSSSGSNSHNKFYSNTIQNCNIGISMIGFVDIAPFGFADTGNDIGGNTIATGNSILNFGGGGSTNASCAIKTLSQYNLNVAYNVINNNTGSGINHTALLRGIYIGAALCANSSVNNNTVTLQGGATGSQLSIIENASGSGASNNTVSISANLIVNCSYQTSVSGPFYGIWNNASPDNLNITYNVFLNNSTGASGGSTYLIYNNGAVASMVSISNNTLSFMYNGSAVYSGNMYSIYNSGGTNATSVYLNNNHFSNYTHLYFTASGAMYFIFNTNDSDEIHVNNNVWSNLSLNHSGAEYLIYNNSDTQSQLSMNGNSIYGSLNRSASAGATYLCYNTGSSPANCLQTISGNNFSDINAPSAGTGVFYGIYSNDGSGNPYPRKLVYNNRVSNVNINSTGLCYVYYLDDLGDGNMVLPSSVYGNTLSAINRSGTVYGMYLGGLVSPNHIPEVYANLISGISSTGITSAIYAAYLSGGGAGLNFHKNRINNVNAYGTSGAGYGVYITNGVNTTLSNNYIGHLNTPNSGITNALNGIYINSGTLINLFYNTVFLNAQSLGGNFNSNALYASATSSLNLKNTILINLTSGGTGISAAYRRSSTSLINYLSTSNNNLFYAGVPGASNVILQNGSASYSTLAAFQTLVSPRESASASQNITFLSVNYASPNYLHTSPNIVSPLESGAVNVPGIISDYDSQTRHGNPGYSGTGFSPDIGADEYDQNINPCNSAHAGTISAGTYTLCAGQSASLISNGYTPGTGLSHQWKVSSTSGSSYTSVTGGTGSATPEFYSSALGAGVYYFVFETTCASLSLTATSTEATLVVNPIPSVSANAATTLVCAGQTLNLLGSSGPGVSYQWAGPAGFNSVMQNPVFTNVLSNSAGVYSVSVSLNNCTSSPATVSVSVSETTLHILSTTNTLCSGNASTLTLATSALSYTWNTSSNASVMVVSPAITTVYSVAVTNTANCIASESITISVINPDILANHKIACGNSATVILSVNAFTPSVINWFSSATSTNSIANGQNYSLSVSTSTTLYAQASNSVIGCQSLRVPVSLTLSPNPSLTIAANPATVCPGGSCTLVASGADTYSWTGLGSGGLKIVSPITNQIYTLTGQNSFGCASSETVYINTFAVASVSVTQSASLVCPSGVVGFTATGLNSYIWNTGANGSITTVTPATNSTYTVYGIDTNNCVSAKTLAVNTKSVPLISILQSTNSMCAGEVVTFTASGAMSYTWLPGGTISNVFSAAPVVASVYNAVGKSINTCTNVGIAMVDVTPCTSIFKNEIKNRYVKISPNPSDGKFELDFGFEGEKKIAVFSLEGKLIFQRTCFSVVESIDLSGLAKGFYNIKITFETSSLNKKLILK